MLISSGDDYSKWIHLSIYLLKLMLHSALVRGGSVGSQEPTKFWKLLSLNVWDCSWYGTQETHTSEFLTRALYMTFYFISFIWRSCLKIFFKILFKDFVWRFCSIWGSLHCKYIQTNYSHQAVIWLDLQYLAV